MTVAEPRATAVLDYIEAQRDALIQLACDLVATPSINPPGSEQAVAALLQQRMAALGLPPSEVVAAEPQRPNLVVRLRGTGGGPTLLLNGHSDTKPVSATDRVLWRTDPLEPTIRDGQLYGLGATDMKGGVAAMVYAAAALARLDPPPAGDVLLVLTADEEATTGLGARYLVDHYPVVADAGLVAEPNGIHHDFENLPLFCRGTFYFKVKVYGTQTHASISDQVPAINASTKMAWVLWRMSRDLRLTHEPHPLCPLGPTVTPGVLVSGGLYYGVHPGYAEFAVDIRLVPGMTHEQVQADVEAFLDQLKAEDPELRTELEIVGGSIQAMLTGDEPFVQALLAASERILGRRPPFGAYPAFTDAYHFHARRGIPTVPAYGPGLLTLAHGSNESVGIERIVEAAKIYALAALDYLA